MKELELKITDKECNEVHSISAVSNDSNIFELGANIKILSHNGMFTEDFSKNYSPSDFHYNFQDFQKSLGYITRNNPKLKGEYDLIIKVRGNQK